MLAFAKYIADFVNKHPSMKILALSFLLMIGVMLLVDPTNLDRSPLTKEFIRQQVGELRDVRFVGGTNAISDNVVNQVKTAVAAGPPPAQIAAARTALEEARRARADELAIREYDAAVRHLNVAESTWNERHDARTAAHRR